jgi:formylglycine-generating enzyme required for sulfatase activity
MKSLVIILLGGLFIVSCSGPSGHLVGVQGRNPYIPEVPLGMLYIPSGGFNMGQSDQDVPFLHQTRSKTVSVQAFYMDQTEITNNEYRQFVFWVRDSIAREYIYDVNDANLGAGGEEPIEAEDQAEWLEYKDEWFDEANVAWVEFDPTMKIENREVFGFNWRQKLDYYDRQLMPYLTEMYLPDYERFYKRREIDTRKLIFKYEWIDLVEAAKRGRHHIIRDGYNNKQKKVNKTHRTLKNPPHPFTEQPDGREKDMGYFNKKGQNNALRGHDDRSRFIIQEEINVYPDTLCWVRDFTYSFNDPMTNMYFWHPAYDNYPVVGVTWVQAKAFCVWRTQLLNTWLIQNGDLFVNDFRLPTEAEWERAARGDLELSAYPWGGPYIRNSSGCFLGNFKPMRGRYFDDGGFHTVKAYSYNPNGWGLYCMAGNAAEWTETTYDESVYEFSHDLNTEYRYYAMDWDPPSMKRKVIRGGSWKDVGYYLQTGTRTYEYRDTAKCYIGFRCVMTHLGRGGRDFSKEGGEEIKSDIQLN